MNHIISMYFLRICFYGSFSIRILRSISTHSNKLTNQSVSQNQKPELNQNLEELIQKYQKRLIFNSFINEKFPHLNYNINYMLQRKLAYEESRKRRELALVEPLPIVLKYTPGYSEINTEDTVENTPTLKPSVIQFPYNLQNATIANAIDNEQQITETIEHVAEVSESEVKTRYDAFKHVDTRDWMTEYENYDEADNEDDVNEWSINYGTPNPNSSVSNIPCGGCGALLHCKDVSIPGYIPSEIYQNCFKRGGNDLKSLICQRCHFLKNYDVALQVRVAQEDYLKVLETIKDKFALIILMVDLLDFPCSIWPGIVDVVGSKKPIIVVGNKVDLLPQDSRNYLQRIKEDLKEIVLQTVSSKSTANIKHIELISAKTGWGVEELINKLHNLWKYRGDVYLVGSTNVGKSSLFNCLLQSDYCKVQAVDLVQRATTSIWPGTTLNLLKFPILRPSGWRLYVRTKRLQSQQRITAVEAKLNKMQLRATKDPKYATLIGRLDRSFIDQQEPTGVSDPFNVSSSSNSTGRIRLGINENHPDYAASKWCFDTPGVVQETQILHLLTTEELMLTLPRTLIQPKSFNVRLNQTLMIAGLGRVDYTMGPPIIKLTVFCANALPITLANTEDACLLYEEFLGTDVLQVPKGSYDRLKQWPALKMAGPFKMIGSKDRSSCGDIVLSNAGWVAVQCEPECEVIFNAWTPEGRGIFSRKSLLPYAVKLKGTKLHKSPTYIHDKAFIAN